LYFCEAPVAYLTLDTEEIERVKSYRQQMQAKALVGSYVTTDQLREKVREDLTRLIRRMKEEGKIPAVPLSEEAVTGAEPSQAAGIGSTLETVVAPAERLQDLREILIGYRAKWQGQFTNIDATDPSIDRRRDLMREVSRVIWEVVQRVEIRCPEAPVQASLTSLASTADELVNMQIYLDGGQSFNALNDGCKNVINGVQDVTAEPWECGG
jgi:hypothetical protein